MTKNNEGQIESKLKVSVIMPVYNVEKYVGKAIESVLGQTLKEIEFFAVDDGSMDESGKICDEYAKKDQRMTVIHKKNGGAPEARNAAIKKAKGEYLYFIDSDDWIEKDYLEKMYRLAEKNNADLVVTGILMEYEKDGVTTTYSTQGTDAVYKNKGDFRANAYKYFSNSIFSFACNKLVRRTIVIKNDIKFPSVKWDDFHFNLDVLKCVDVVVISSMAKYHWHRSRSDSETATLYTDVEGMFQARLAHYKHMLELYKDWHMENDAKGRAAINSYFIGRAFQCLQELSGCKSVAYSKRRQMAREILDNEYAKMALKETGALSPKLRIMVLPMKMHNVTLCLWCGNIINFVRRNFENAFNKIKEKEVHGK